MQDAALVLDHLERVETQIRSSKKKITEQLEFIAWLEWYGSDTMGAKGLLRGFERSLARQIADQARLRVELELFDVAPDSFNARRRVGYAGDPHPPADETFAAAVASAV